VLYGFNSETTRQTLIHLPYSVKKKEAWMNSIPFLPIRLGKKKTAPSFGTFVAGRKGGTFMTLFCYG